MAGDGMVESPPTPSTSFLRDMQKGKGFVALGCKCSCEVCMPTYFKSLALVNRHKSVLSRRESGNKRARLIKDGCLCANSNLLDIPDDPSEKEELLRDHCFYFTGQKHKRGHVTAYNRGVSLAEIQVNCCLPNASSFDVAGAVVRIC